MQVKKNKAMCFFNGIYILLYRCRLILSKAIDTYSHLAIHETVIQRKESCSEIHREKKNLAFSGGNRTHKLCISGSLLQPIEVRFL